MLIKNRVHWRVRLTYLNDTFNLFEEVQIKAFKACVRYFLFFQQMAVLQKLRKMLFISSKKLFSFLRYSNFCIFILPSFFPLSAIALEDDRR